MKAKHRKILAEIDTLLIQANKHFESIREESERVFGDKLLAPDWIEWFNLKRFTVEDMEELLSLGAIEFHPTNPTKIRRKGLPEGYYSSTIS